MTDDRLRALERRFGETGTTEDEAAWLKERVRAGELAQDRLELAASLDHDAASVALGGVQAVGLEALIESLADFDSFACVRACLAAAWVVIPLWSPGPRDDPRPGIEAAESWLVSGRESAIEEAARFTYVTPDGLGLRSPDLAVRLSVGVWATTSQAISCAVAVSGLPGRETADGGFEQPYAPLRAQRANVGAATGLPE